VVVALDDAADRPIGAQAVTCRPHAELGPRTGCGVAAPREAGLGDCPRVRRISSHGPLHPRAWEILLTPESISPAILRGSASGTRTPLLRGRRSSAGAASHPRRCWPQPTPRTPSPL